MLVTVVSKNHETRATAMGFLKVDAVVGSPKQGFLPTFNKV